MTPVEPLSPGMPLLELLKLETPLPEAAFAEVLIAFERLDSVAMDSELVVGILVADKLVEVNGEKSPLLEEEVPAALLEMMV